MKTVTCSVDGCDHESVIDIWPEDDSRAFLCDHHHYETLAHEWTSFDVDGRVLICDSSRMWFFMPESDPVLHKLARKAGLP